MKVVIAVDSLKGSLSSIEAAQAAKEGILKVYPAAEVVIKPLADGGEGTTEALVEGLGGTFVNIEAAGPMGGLVNARYGILPDQSHLNSGQKTAVIEMAQAAGITLIERGCLNPWKASTTGVGEMILDALGRGCHRFIIAIGGSATTEGGIGLLQALGFTFFDASGALLPPEFASLHKIEKISSRHVPDELWECCFQIACDVTNPLCGKDGAVFVYGPQKGVKPEEQETMDQAIRHYALKTAEFTGCDYSMAPGAGAAGGLGFAIQSYLPHVELKSGAQIVLEAVGLEKALADADYVVTGEGCLDAQTAMGKAPVRAAQLAKKYGCTVLAFAGSVTDGACRCNSEGIDAFFPIVRGVMSLEQAMEVETARKNMSLSVEQAFRLLRTK